jgi:hypothetical protein
MYKFLTGLVLGIGAIILIGLLAVFSGTVIWLIWPVAVPATFPGLVASGVIAGKISWWTSVCLSWLFGLLIKGSVSATRKKE